jgi:diphthine-ammonia ligase
MKSILNIGCSWSGGKDSCYALMEAQKSAVPKVLLNMMNENGLISRSHGLPFSLLHQQAEAITLPIMAVPTSWSNYEATFINTLVKIKSGYQVEGVVFGDIDLQAHRDWEEMVCEKSGVKAILPLWQKKPETVIAGDAFSRH